MSNTSTTSVPTWKTEFDERIKAFAEAIGLDEAKVRETLKGYGADGESSHSLDMIDSEEALPMQELFTLFVDSGLVPKGRLRLGVATLRGKTHLEEAATTNGDSDLGEVCGAIKDMVASNRPKSDWSDEELLKVYDQDATEAADILRKRTHGRPCIVFHRDQSVNVPASLKLVKTAKRQPTSNQFVWEKKPVRVYRAGDFLAKPIDESPFFPGIALVDGYCSQSGTDWSGIDHKTRVLVRIYVRDIETAQLSKMQMKEICTTAAKDEGMKAFEFFYPEALLRYEELESQDKLPKLKIMPDEVRPEPYDGGRDDGFGGRTPHKFG